MRKVGYQVTWGPDKNIIAFAKDFHSPVRTCAHARRPHAHKRAHMAERPPPSASCFCS